MIENVGIVGLGLIGGSVAKTLKKAAPTTRITAYDADAKTLERAAGEGVIDAAATAKLAEFSQCGAVFICVDVKGATSIIEKLAGVVSKNCVVTDVGSVKGGVVAFAEKFPDMQFVGAHPMAGSEKSGYDASTDFLFENAYYIIVPTKQATERSVEVVKGFATMFGAIPIDLSAAEHDKITAEISHLPHLLASALVNLALRGDERAAELAAGGFRDVTRIASADSRLWQGICAENSVEILAALRAFRAELDEIERYLESGNHELGGYLRLAKTRRDALPTGGGARNAKTFALMLDVEDKPGEIALVTTVLGVNGVSVKNIGIENSREYEGGVLRVNFGTDKDKRKAVKLLRSMNFNVYEV